MNSARFAALALCACLVACVSAPRVPKADRVFFGRVVTMDPEQPEVEALAIKDGRIVAIGTERELRAYVGADTWVTELDEGALLPGIIDLRGGLLETAPLDESGDPDLAAAQRAAAQDGVTTATVGAADARQLTLLDAANLAGSLELDVVALPRAEEATRLIGRRDFQRYRGRLRLAGIRFDVVGDEQEGWNRLLRHCAVNDVRIFASCLDAGALDRFLAALESFPAGVRADHPIALCDADPGAPLLERCVKFDVQVVSRNFDRNTANALTADAAFQLEESDEKGSLVPGKRADLVVLSTDPTGLTVAELREVEVWQTYKDGLLIYELEGRPLRPFRRLRDQ
ncbi:MAG: amidohydrolase family protein [Planctomycetes bacterium]|nr:amidohydrolase family protein [Planctomycetota bacterium]MCB9902823.1 amidohydrolase family protein [Planctomycetota bacterium]